MTSNNDDPCKGGVTDDEKKFYMPLLHFPGRIVFRCTLFFTILYDLFISKIRILGKENLIHPSHGAFLVSNHTLYLDPGLIAHAIAPYRTCFTAKEETFMVKGLGRYIRYLGAFPVSGSMPFHLLTSTIQRIFLKKHFIHFFPEGELTHLNGTINRFKTGVFFLAFRFNKPVIPITIIPRPRQSLSRRLNKYFCKVTVKIGRPVYPYQFKIKGRTMIQQITGMADYCRELMKEDMEKPYKQQAASF
jgi:1-acyl-sn-glycerol-3-phosphate acyltransferase